MKGKHTFRLLSGAVHTLGANQEQLVREHLTREGSNHRGNIWTRVGKHWSSHTLAISCALVLTLKVKAWTSVLQPFNRSEVYTEHTETASGGGRRGKHCGHPPGQDIWVSWTQVNGSIAQFRPGWFDIDLGESDLSRCSLSWCHVCPDKVCLCLSKFFLKHFHPDPQLTWNRWWSQAPHQAFNQLQSHSHHY